MTQDYEQGRGFGPADVEAIASYGLEHLEKFWGHVVTRLKHKRELPVFGLPGASYMRDGRQFYHWSMEFKEPSR